MAKPSPERRHSRSGASHGYPSVVSHENNLPISLLENQNVHGQVWLAASVPADDDYAVVRIV